MKHSCHEYTCRDLREHRFHRRAATIWPLLAVDLCSRPRIALLRFSEHFSRTVLMHLTVGQRSSLSPPALYRYVIGAVTQTATWSQVPVIFGILAFVYAGHGVFPSIQASMKKPKDFPKVNPPLNLSSIYLCFHTPDALLGAPSLETGSLLIFPCKLKVQVANISCAIEQRKKDH